MTLWVAIELADARAQSRRLCDLRRHGRPRTTCGRLSRQAHANATQEFDAARVVTLLKYAKRLEPAVVDEDSQNTLQVVVKS